MQSITNLETYLENWAGPDDLRRKTASVMLALAHSSCAIADLIAMGPLGGSLAAVRGDNADGDAQTELDIVANQMLIEALRDQPVCHIISEELTDPLTNQIDAPLSIAVDPLDGSSNIDTNLSIGTIFSIFDNSDVTTKGNGPHILQPGTMQMAAGYVIYGPQTALVMTVGEGTHIFTLNRATREFCLTAVNIMIPKDTKEFAINVSNFRHWDTPVRTYIDDCLNGQDGLRRRNFNMRWVASLVAECHRILSRGGIFLYPGDQRKGYQNGRLRLIYEANPIAWLIEQAGGAATTGRHRILEIEPKHPHERAPLIFGSRHEVERVARQYTEINEPTENAPLFAKRGLFLK